MRTVYVFAIVALAAAAAVGGPVRAAPINPVAFDSLNPANVVTVLDIIDATSGFPVVDSSVFPSGTAPASVIDSTLAFPGLSIGERFAGQTTTQIGTIDGIDLNGPWDDVQGTPNTELQAEAGAPSQNLGAVVQDIIPGEFAGILFGVGPAGATEFDGNGEGAIAFAFDQDQSEFGFRLPGGNLGQATLIFFNRSGDTIDVLTPTVSGETSFGFVRDGGVRDVAGVLIQNTDPGGIGVFDIAFDVVPEEPVPGTAQFSDSRFYDADWEPVDQVVGSGNESSAIQQSGGGNPGTYRETSTVISSGNAEQRVFSFHFQGDALHDPQTEGAILSIDFQADVIVLSGSSQTWGAAIRQGGNLYAVLDAPATPTWTQVQDVGITASDFNLADVSFPGGFDTASHPDFSASGSPIQFGYFRGLGNPGGTTDETTVGGTDNWSVTAFLETGCSPIPVEPCRELTSRGGSKIDLKLNKGKVSWRWKKGEATDKAAFSDPSAAIDPTNYALCIYDHEEGVASLVASYGAPGGEAWTEKTKGFKYQNDEPGRLRKAILKAGGDGKAKIVNVKGKKLDVPPLPLNQDPRVIVQLISDAGGCWATEHSAPAKKNSGKRFLDKAD